MLGTTLPSGGPFPEPPGGPFRDERASSPEEIIQIIRRVGTKLALRLYASVGNTRCVPLRSDVERACAGASALSASV